MPNAEDHTLSLHDALPISAQLREWTSSHRQAGRTIGLVPTMGYLHEGHLRLVDERSEEHTSELQSRRDLVCRLLLEKKNVCFGRAILGLAHAHIAIAYHHR